MTIVHHTAYSWLRKNRPAAVVLVEDVEAIERTHSIELDAETPETALIAKEGATLLATAIATLSAPLRQTLLLREVQEVGTVMSRLARARSRIISIVRTAGARPN